MDYARIKAPGDANGRSSGVLEVSASTDPSVAELEKLIGYEMVNIDRRVMHAWRPIQVTNELRDLNGPYDYNKGLTVRLRHRQLRDYSSDPTKQHIEIYRADEWHDLEGRVVWNYEDGEIYLRNYYPTEYGVGDDQLRVSYVYGGMIEEAQDIRECCVKLVAAHLLDTSWTRSSFGIVEGV